MKNNHTVDNIFHALQLMVLAVCFWVANTPPVFAAASITMDALCAYGTASCDVSGTVSGVDYTRYTVAPYIKVDEAWWTKPYSTSPTCPIGSNGRYVCDITTGGADLYATAVRVFLMPKGSNPALCLPCQASPSNANSAASVLRNRPYPRTLAFSGYQWRVKKAVAPYTLGPGPNHFSDSTNDVWVDNKGLHLRIRRISEEWYATEVILQQSLGYGTYIFQTNSRIDTIDPNAVLAFFTWDGETYHPTHREMDIEFSKWGNPSNATNAQFIVEPLNKACNIGLDCSRFLLNVPSSNNHMTFYIVWSPGKVEYRAYRGQYWNAPPATSLVRKWIYTGTNTPVPTPGKENIRFNFWLFNGTPPMNGLGNEAIIENFVFRPLCSPVLQ